MCSSDLEILGYWGLPESPIAVSKIDDKTLRISLYATSAWGHRKQWQGLTFEYDIHPMEPLRSSSPQEETKKPAP